MKHIKETHTKRSAWSKSQTLMKPVKAELDKPAKVLIIPTSTGMQAGWGGSPARSRESGHRGPAWAGNSLNRPLTVSSN